MLCYVMWSRCSCTAAAMHDHWCGPQTCIARVTVVHAIGCRVRGKMVNNFHLSADARCVGGLVTGHGWTASCWCGSHTVNSDYTRCTGGQFAGVAQKLDREWIIGSKKAVSSNHRSPVCEDWVPLTSLVSSDSSDLDTQQCQTSQSVLTHRAA